MIEKGISKFTRRWIANFLSNRKQYVMANGKLSKVAPITNGVPQGSVLGPILFLLIIDSIGDIDSNLTIACFADNTKLFPLLRMQTIFSYVLRNSTNGKLTIICALIMRNFHYQTMEGIMN